LFPCITQVNAVMKRAFNITLVVALAAFLILPMPGHSSSLHRRMDIVRAKIGAKKAKEGVLTSTITRYDRKIQSLQGEIRGLQDQSRCLARRSAERARRPRGDPLARPLHPPAAGGRPLEDASRGGGPAAGRAAAHSRGRGCDPARYGLDDLAGERPDHLAV